MTMHKPCLAVGAAALILLPSQLMAQTGGDDASTQIATTPSGDPGPICTDRPTKSNVTCTVPQGAVQVEADVFSWTRLAATPARTDVLVYTNPTVKYGLGDNSDIQLNIAPLVEVRTRVGEQTVNQRGVGDLTIRFKQRLTGPDDAVQVTLLPFVKAPTAERGIGNEQWEGGLIVPVQLEIGPAMLTLVPQVNLLAGALAPQRRHLEFQGLANLAVPIAPRTTLAGEVWTSQNWDPAGTLRQYSADAALSYLLHDELQLDLGGNFGLNRATPDVQVYLGLSARF
ncbi:transporter [Novosphingobium piscinae]|uniref:Transporter n=1 Tax=Novosphingobium piscinae TaxID=1507448 RepID=A0A7X1FWZ9_9SPHN|nr:transporter [Novosphingobium piscinae]MBC2668491.1 transporter [Novosphingobium piscinae]